MARKKVEKGVTLVAADTQVNGDIKFVDQLFVNGAVVGNVIAENDDATLIVSEEGFVSGEIRVPNVVINGTVEGNVFAQLQLELATNARVKGNLYYKVMEMQLGARVDGTLINGDGADEFNENVHKLPLEN